MKPELTLSDAIRMALVHNPDTGMARFRIRQAEAVVERAKAEFYPTVGVYTEYIQGDAPSTYLFKTIDQRKLPDAVDFNEPGWFENLESGIQFKMNLYNGGRDLLDRQIAENTLFSRIEDRRRVENDLINAVITTYYDALAAEDFIRIARESVTTIRSELELMQVRLSAGGALKSDLLSLDVRLAQAREEVIRHRNRFETALTALTGLLGLNPEGKIKLARGDVDLPSLPQDYAGGALYALAHRPEVAKARQQVVGSKMALDRSQSGYLPRLDLLTRYYVDDSIGKYSGSRDNWTAAVMLNWDLFTGFSTRAQKMQAEAVLAEMLAGDRKAVLSIKTDVKTAYLNLDAARARLAVAEKSIASAEETLNLVRQQFEGGSVTITRYLEAELARNRSRTRTAAAYYNREKAQADLGRAMGLWATFSRTLQDEKEK